MLIYLFFIVFSEPTPCKSDDDCSEFGDDTKCEDSFCVCNSSIICEEKTSIVATTVGESCVHNRDCKIDNAQCKDEKCVCKPKYVEIPNGKRCLKSKFI